MGRKIPGKKHRGVKDPNKQREKRLSELGTKINAPPKNIDDQDVPKSLERLIKLKNAIKNNGIVQKRKKKKKSLKLIQIGAESYKQPHPKARPDKVVPVFNQKPGENHYQFWNRVNRETQAFIKETKFENKFNVEVKRNPKSGVIESVIKKPKDELEELVKLKAKHKNIKKKKKVTKTEDNVKLTKTQKKKEKLLKKKEKRNQDDIDEFKTFKDNVEFGDIVHAPPDLKIRSRNTDKSATKVNTKSLLLNSILQKSNSSENESTKPIDRTGKRKDLPIGERRQLEQQQKDIIAAYRSLKAKKLGESTMSA